MKTIFVTGATGFIGSELLSSLLEKGYSVNALVRNPELFEQKHQNLQSFTGDLFNKEVLYEGMKGCSTVFHLAAHTKIWDKNTNAYFKVHVEGTQNVLEVARHHSIKKVIITSTAGVFGPSSQTPISESKPFPGVFYTLYEKSKFMEEELIDSYIQDGLNIIRIYPTRVYGPGVISKSNSVTKLILKYMKGSWHILPGKGDKIGNYVFITDIISGLMHAMERNIQNERIILGGTNISYLGFFNTIFSVTHRKSWLVKTPLFVMLIVAGISKVLAEIFGIQPLITAGWVRKYMVDWETCSTKAKEILEYKITPLEEGIRKTAQWLKKSDES